MSAEVPAAVDEKSLSASLTKTVEVSAVLPEAAWRGVL